jgi:2-polyprenyl-3-methyl-5-hydroxy-6-metoxy-1,4-benzoquinol methylase
MVTQQAIGRWFDRTYSEKGLTYLRPSEFYSVFMEYLAVKPGTRLLDIGCGPGLLLNQATARGAFAVGIDVSGSGLSMVAAAAPDAHCSLCNAEALCWPNAFFDCITCIGVFEHILQPERALDEMRRVTRPDGQICIMVPNSLTLRWQFESKVLRIHDEDSNERASTFATWRALFLRNGFGIDSVYWDEWPGYVRRLRTSGGRCGTFAAYGSRKRHLLPLQLSNQFVFILRPEPGRPHVKM